MHARIGIVSLAADELEDAVQIAVTQAYPALRVLPGCRGGAVLSDREGGEALVITIWETEEDMRRSEEEAATLRGDTAEALEVGEIPVERYTVDLLDLPDA